MELEILKPTKDMLNIVIKKYNLKGYDEAIMILICDFLLIKAKEGEE